MNVNERLKEVIRNAHCLSLFAEPSQPETPEVVMKGKETITVRLKPVVNDHGPVSKYRVVVSSEPGIYFDNKYLKSWVEAKKETLPYYIAAELHSQVMILSLFLG